MTLRHQSY